MKDDEIQRALGGLDSALAVFRRYERHLDRPDAQIRGALAAMRQELALYRAVSRTVERQNRRTLSPD
jgi:hypothetical protein